MYLQLTPIVNPVTHQVFTLFTFMPNTPPMNRHPTQIVDGGQIGVKSSDQQLNPSSMDHEYFFPLVQNPTRPNISYGPILSTSFAHIS